MIYCGTVKNEEIAIRLDDGRYEYVELTLSSNTPTFLVSCDFYDGWEWEFNMDDPAVYEIVKHTIMDAVFECDDMDDMLETLDEVFETDYADFLVECDGACQHCKYMN